MSSSPRHRGAHPEDPGLFAPDAVPVLRSAVRDLCWLWTRGYGQRASVKLVGDRYALRQRAREAAMRSAAGAEARRARRARVREPEAANGGRLWLDGYNVLTTVEAALAGGPLFLGADGALRDLASVHGTFREVAETGAAARLIGASLAEAGAREVVWVLDRPVGNSRRLTGRLERLADEAGWPWRIELAESADRRLTGGEEPVATADSVVLDQVGAWVNLARRVVAARVPDAWVLDLRPHGRGVDRAS